MSSIFGSILGAGISAGSSILSSVIGNNQTRSNMRLQADLNKQLGDHDREENYRIAKDQLADERAYNDPSAQMARYMKAGLNPNLIYGQVNPNAPSIASSLGASTSGVGLGASASPDFSGLANGALTAAQIKNIEADTRNKDANTHKVSVEINGIETDIMVSSTLLPWQVRQIESNIMQAEQERKESVARIDNLFAERGLTLQTIQQNAQSFPFTIKLLEEQGIVTHEQGRLLAAQVLTEGAKRHNLNADTAYKGQLKEYVTAQTQTENDLRENRNKLLVEQAKDSKASAGVKQIEINNYNDLKEWLKKNGLSIGETQARELLARIAVVGLSETQIKQEIEKLKLENEKTRHSLWKFGSSE